MTERNNPAADAAGREFVLTRTFDAPRSLMWKAWTESDRLGQWFGPRGFKVFHSKNDARPGGTFHYGMKSPDGNTMWGKWVYREISEPNRLVFVTSFSDEKGGITRHPLVPDWPHELLSAILFDEKDGKTTVTVKWVPINATETERNVFKNTRPSMNSGWGGTFDQLEAYLAEVQR